MKDRNQILHYRSSTSGATPSSEKLQYGEIAVTYASGDEKMFIKNTNDEIIAFKSTNTTDANDIKLGEVEPYDSGSTVLNSANTINQTFVDLEKEVIEDEAAYAELYNGINEKIPTEATSTNQLADKLYVDTKVSVYGTEHTVNLIYMSGTTETIAPNTFYIWGEVEELDITLGTPEDESIYNEYMFQFTSGENATTLTLPEGITWYLNNDTILSNKTYQVSILNNFGILGEF